MEASKIDQWLKDNAEAVKGRSAEEISAVIAQKSGYDVGEVQSYISQTRAQKTQQWLQDNKDVIASIPQAELPGLIAQKSGYSVDEIHNYMKVQPNAPQGPEVTSDYMQVQVPDYTEPEDGTATANVEVYSPYKQEGQDLNVTSIPPENPLHPDYAKISEDKYQQELQKRVEIAKSIIDGDELGKALVVDPKTGKILPITSDYHMGDMHYGVDVEFLLAGKLFEGALAFATHPKPFQLVLGNILDRVNNRKLYEYTKKQFDLSEHDVDKIYSNWSKVMDEADTYANRVRAIFDNAGEAGAVAKNKAAVASPEAMMQLQKNAKHRRDAIVGLTEGAEDVTNTAEAIGRAKRIVQNNYGEVKESIKINAVPAKYDIPDPLDEATAGDARAVKQLLTKEEITTGDLIDAMPHINAMIRKTKSSTKYNWEQVGKKVEANLKDSLSSEDFKAWKDVNNDYSRMMNVTTHKAGKLVTQALEGELTSADALNKLASLSAGDTFFNDLQFLVGSGKATAFEKAIIKEAIGSHPDKLNWGTLAKNLDKKGFITDEGKNLQKVIDNISKSFATDDKLRAMWWESKGGSTGWSDDLMARFRFAIVGKIYNKLAKSLTFGEVGRAIKYEDQLLDLLRKPTKVRDFNLKLAALSPEVKEGIAMSVVEEGTGLKFKHYGLEGHIAGGAMGAATIQDDDSPTVAISKVIGFSLAGGALGRLKGKATDITLKHRGANWYELEDFKSRLKIDSWNLEDGKLGDIMQGVPEALKDVKVKFKPMDNKYAGVYHEGADTITINKNMIKPFRFTSNKNKVGTTLVHEMTHAWQAREGLPRGGGKYTFDTLKNTKELTNYYVTKQPGFTGGYNGYRNMLGEQQARANANQSTEEVSGYVVVNGKGLIPEVAKKWLDGAPMTEAEMDTIRGFSTGEILSTMDPGFKFGPVDEAYNVIINSRIRNAVNELVGAGTKKMKPESLKNYLRKQGVLEDAINLMIKETDGDVLDLQRELVLEYDILKIHQYSDDWLVNNKNGETLVMQVPHEAVPTKYSHFGNGDSPAWVRLSNNENAVYLEEVQIEKFGSHSKIKNYSPIRKWGVYQAIEKAVKEDIPLVRIPIQGFSGRSPEVMLSYYDNMPPIIQKLAKKHPGIKYKGIQRNKEYEDTDYNIEEFKDTLEKIKDKLKWAKSPSPELVAQQKSIERLLTEFPKSGNYNIEIELDLKKLKDEDIVFEIY